MPAFRPLKIYAFDPTRGRKLNNYMRANVRYERLERGPVGEYIAVIDYDGTNRRYYQPVNLDDPEVMIGGGLEPSESDPRFHQQMVYAVIMETIRRFEFALGRKVKWKKDSSSKLSPYHGKLRVFPHGVEDANAFYDPDLRAIVFGYFAAGDSDVGGNLPGQTVFTCLSHDVIVHETTHALIDGLRDKFTVSTNPDTAAFHEAFADIVALFEHFGYEEPLIDVIDRTGGYLYRAQLAPNGPQGSTAPDSAVGGERPEANPLIDLAQQFGTALGMRSGLRQAIGTKADPKDLEKATEEHERGAILVAAVFDAFFSIYLARTRDLLRLASATGISLGGHLHPDLTKRLAGEASKTAKQVCTICIRALDYCPPVDISFGEFLRALVTADWDLMPSDPRGYRAAFIEAFRARGIVPEDVVSYSEEALLWAPPEVDDDHPLKPCKGLSLDVFEDDNPRRNVRNAVVLHSWAKSNPGPLGLSTTDPISVPAFHPLHRVGPDGQLCFEYVVELLQKRDVPVDPADPSAGTFPFYGGATVILDRHGKVRYTVIKRIENERRLERERQYRREDALAFTPGAAFMKPNLAEGLRFAAVHRGY